MGFSESLTEALEYSRNYEFGKEMTLDEVYSVILDSDIPKEITGEYILKNSLFNKKIVFIGPKDCTGELTVKGNKAKLTKITKQTGSGLTVNGIPVTAGAKGSLDNTNLENTFFKALADALGEILR